MTLKNLYSDAIATLTDEECADLDWSTRSDAPCDESLLSHHAYASAWDEEQQEEQQEEQEEDNY